MYTMFKDKRKELHIMNVFIEKKKNIYIYIYILSLSERDDWCRGRFCDKGQDCKMSPKTPLGFVKFICYWKVKPKICNAEYTKANGAL